jgi:hypothetical protein
VRTSFIQISFLKISKNFKFVLKPYLKQTSSSSAKKKHIHHLGLEMFHTNNSPAATAATWRLLLEHQSADISGMHPLSTDRMAW